jgi:hypothetical protein
MSTRQKAVSEEVLRAVHAGRKSQLRQPLDVPVPDGARVAVQSNGTLRWQKDAQRGELSCPLGAVGEWLNLHTRGSTTAPVAVEILRIRVQRVQDMTGDEMRAELAIAEQVDGRDERAEFVAWWNQIHAQRGATFESNPWVWVVEFKPVD